MTALGGLGRTVVTKKLSLFLQHFLPTENLVAAGTAKALLVVPSIVTLDARTDDGLETGKALLAHFLLVALLAHDVAVVVLEAFADEGRLAHDAVEALLVPRLGLELEERDRR